MKGNVSTTPSGHHNNRQFHNWLVYDILDQFLLNYSHLFKGVLYDLGCGNTFLKDFLLTHADEYFGVDWSNTIHDFKGDIIADLNETLPIDSEVADTVICLSVMEHLHSPQNLLDESFRILKKGGVCFLQVPWQWWIHEAPYDYFRYTPFALQLMFQKAGYSDIEVLPSSGFFTTLILKLNYFSLRMINRQKRILRGFLKLIFIPLWYIRQKLAPYLDRLDDNWSAEAQGYFVIAKKLDS